MCCAECLAKSGVAGMHSKHEEGQLPAMVAGATACMKPMEEGCACQRWVGGARVERNAGEDVIHPSTAFPGCCNAAEMG